ncbi:MAG: hopanoid biosynthesis-associated protein HpnK, partial [Verrucomicrobiia bacterium]
GKSSGANHAVAMAHQKGILTSASLMVTGNAFDEAVAIAKANPGLGVGLHLTLLCGRSCLPKHQIPALVDERGRFSDNPARTGLRYFFDRTLRSELAGEIAAQFNRFRETGLPLDHVNGHLNIHLHPTVTRLLLPFVTMPRPVPIRLTRDFFWLNCQIARGRYLYRSSHAIIFACLSAWAGPRLRKARIPHTDAVFGLLQNGCVDEDYLLRLMPRLPAGDYELYSHPSLDQSRAELEALVSDRVRGLVRQLNIRLIRYSEL